MKEIAAVLFMVEPRQQNTRRIRVGAGTRAAVSILLTKDADLCDLSLGAAVDLVAGTPLSRLQD